MALRLGQVFNVIGAETQSWETGRPWDGETPPRERRDRKANLDRRVLGQRHRKTRTMALGQCTMDTGTETITLALDDTKWY